MAVADWSALSYDILGAIMMKLDAIEDLGRFSTVCRSWNCVFLQVKQLCQPTMPWLLLAKNTKENSECSRKVFSLYTSRCLELELPETIGRRCWGSNYGWIVTVGLDRQMHLFNPITKARLCLPCQRTLPNQPREAGTPSDDEWFRKCFTHKAIVLRIHEDEDFVVMVVYGQWSDLAFARRGDQVWTPMYLYGQTLDEDHYRHIYRQTYGAFDVCYCDGKILAVLGDGALGYCDITSSHQKFLDYLPAPRAILDDRRRMTYKLYLVNSFGDLLIVLRHKHTILEDDELYDELYYETKYFEVFRPNFHTKEWEKVNDLGDVVLFVGDNSSVSVCASHLQRNHIYFTDDEYEFWVLPEKSGGHDIGAYDMESGEIVPIYKDSDSYSTFCTPLWFTPRF